MSDRNPFELPMPRQLGQNAATQAQNAPRDPLQVDQAKLPTIPALSLTAPVGVEQGGPVSEQFIPENFFAALESGLALTHDWARHDQILRWVGVA